jgi:hypothetical protein
MCFHCESALRTLAPYITDIAQGRHQISYLSLNILPSFQIVIGLTLGAHFKLQLYMTFLRVFLYDEVFPSSASAPRLPQLKPLPSSPTVSSLAVRRVGAPLFCKSNSTFPFLVA